jgi:MYXO-CTERM domain-containing protein
VRSFKILIGAACLVAPAPLMAQIFPVELAAAATAGSQDEDEGEGHPRLGLLGLLGLAGLLGLLRREPDIHIDARRKQPPPVS